MANRTAVHVTYKGQEDEMYFFNDREYLRLHPSTGKDVNGSHWITTNWSSLKHLGWDTVDAWLPIPDSSYAYAFRGGEYIKHNLNNEDITVGPAEWKYEWPALAQAGFTRIDAALPWTAHRFGLGKAAWFFSGKRCTLLNVEDGKIEKIVDDISVHWPILKSIRFDTIDIAIIKPGTEASILKSDNEAKEPVIIWFFSGDLMAEIQLNPYTNDFTNESKGALIVKDKWPTLARYYP